MAEFTKYTTKEGETWSLIAYKAYGNVNRMPDLIAANPTAPGGDTLPANVVLNVPVITTAAAQVDNSVLPPWKR